MTGQLMSGLESSFNDAVSLKKPMNVFFFFAVCEVGSFLKEVQ